MSSNTRPVAVTVRCTATAVVLMALSGCASQRPVLYPNERYRAAGATAAQADIDACMRQAEAFVASGGHEAARAREVAGRTAVGAGTGAAVGAVGGAITGSPGQGAAVGAATGATAGFIDGLFGIFRPRGPDPVFTNFVDRCLREKGYEPIGWQ